MAAPIDPVDQLRRRLQHHLRVMLSGNPDPPVHDPARTDPGLFGPHSAAWQVHADVAMFVGALRALLLQTMHPLTMAGVADHSTYRTDPAGRLQRTAAFVAVTTFGTTAEATAAIARVCKVHAMVTGTAPDGRPYRANDPHLLGWVHATEVDSFLGAYQRYSPKPLEPTRTDAYVAEMAGLAERLGVGDPPRSRAELAATIEGYRSELVVGGQAREAVRFLLLPPLPLRARPAYGVISTAAVSLLPGWARRMLWLPVAPGAEPLLVRPAATALLRVLGWALAPQRPKVA